MFMPPRIGKLLFFNDLIKLLDHYLVDNIIIRGDFNAVLDSAVDTSSKGLVTLEIPSRFQKWMLNKGVLDCWWKEHPHERDYTYFSNPHGTFSRIDYIFMLHHSSIQILQTKIGLRTFSVHSLVSLTWKQVGRRSIPYWRLDNSLLLSEEVKVNKEGMTSF